MWPRGGTVGDSVGIRWTWVPSRSSQVNSLSVAGGSTSSKPSSCQSSTVRSIVGGRDLDPDVVQHQNKSDSRAAPTTIAVDQVTASAVISMSRP